MQVSFNKGDKPKYKVFRNKNKKGVGYKNMKKYEIDNMEIYKTETGETIANIEDLDIKEIDRLLQERQLKFI